MGCHFLHGALYFFLLLLKEPQTGLVERGMGGQFLNGALYSFLLLLKRKTYRARRERDGLVANSYMWRSTLFYSFQIETQTGLGETDLGCMTKSCMVPSTPFYSF